MELDRVFADLEIQLLHELDGEVQARILEEERHRLAQLSIRQRLVNLVAHSPAESISVMLASGLQAVVIPKRVGKDWVSVSVCEPQEFHGEAIIPLYALAALTLSSPLAQQSQGVTVAEVNVVELENLTTSPTLTDRITIRFLLRDLAKRRKNVTLLTSQGRLTGRLERVGTDHVQVTLVALETAIVSLVQVECVLLEAQT